MVTYGYYLNKLLEEAKRVCSRGYAKLRRELMTYAEEQVRIEKSVMRNFDLDDRVARNGG